MPINGDLLGYRRRSLPLGQIRMGTSKVVGDKRLPVRLETWRFTTSSRETAATVASFYGGQVSPWDRRRGYLEVITERAELDVWVPPRGKAVDSNMEMWGGSPVKCLRRCDGKTERRSGKPCMCPLPDDPTDPEDVERACAERLRLAKLNPPRACKVRTRYNLAIPELPGLLGVWTVLTGSANAAAESADTGEALARARDADVFLPALLLIDWRPGQDGQPYPVPALRLRQSAAQVAAGELPSGLNGLIAQIQGNSAVSQRAITGTTLPAEDSAASMTAQQIADVAPMASTRHDVEVLAKQAKELGHEAEMVANPATGIWEELREVLADRWKELPATEGAA